MVWRGLCAAVLIMTGLSEAAAIDSDQTVQSLYEMCKKPDASFPSSLCLGYITGVADTMQLLGFGTADHPDLDRFAICAKPSYGAMVQAFITWTEKNPQEGDHNRIIGVMKALRENWPCKTN
jgi:Rap1a immunity proteins